MKRRITMPSITTKQETKLKKVIEIGYEIEANEYNRKFVGYDGFDNATIDSKSRTLRAKSSKLVLELLDEGVEVYELGYTFKDKNGIEWELDYALQF